MRRVGELKKTVAKFKEIAETWLVKPPLKPLSSGEQWSLTKPHISQDPFSSYKHTSTKNKLQSTFPLFSINFSHLLRVRSPTARQSCAGMNSNCSTMHEQAEEGFYQGARFNVFHLAFTAS